ncbi:helix-turn-helix transcriptional regulator [Macrococcoides bohemicum]|uniref:helix-turn-helix domain-containing protein n=1 Tax=Macrococcoides bohemicum TaxID=1903056 RepID=UPI001C5FDB95|nr:helix-turn-helix transcriptional regulator [Macrococcus bohemicus]QYA45453.1 helix-turn-helix transcriptional regulator [Macrococcus bohemicus]
MKNQFSTILGSQKKTMTDVFNATKISRNTLHNLYYEKTANPDSKTVITICEYLGVTPDQFFGYKSLEKED